MMRLKKRPVKLLEALLCHRRSMWRTNAEQTAVWKKLEDGTYVYEHYVMPEGA